MVLFKRVLVAGLFLIIVAQSVFASSKNDTHTITLFVIPSMHPIVWDSPATLYESTKACFLKTLGLADNYLLGHMTVQLESSLLDKPMVLAQTSGTVEEKTNLILKQKIGFGILGATLTGRIETEEEIEHKLSVYAKREKLTFISYRINEKAMKRILSFIEQYQKKITENQAPYNFYGGAFWPRFKNEGAGCSTFGMALLDVVGIKAEDSVWKKQVRIPKEIIGGVFNNNKKNRVRTIKNAVSWHDGNGIPNVDFVNYFSYEPSIMFDWINDYLKENPLSVIQKKGVNGLLLDKQHIEFDETKPLFVERTEPNLFIEYFKKIIQ